MVGTLESQHQWRGGVSVYSPTRRIQPPRRQNQNQLGGGGGGSFQIHGFNGGGGGGLAPDLGQRIQFGMQGQQPAAAQESEGGWRGLLGSVVNNPIGKALLMPLNLLDTPRRLVVSSVKELGDVFAGGASMSDWWDQVKDPNFGVGSFLHVDGPNNLFNRWTNRLIGLGGDILLDPLTYLGGSSMVTGASRRARLMMGAEMMGIEGLQDAASTVARRGVGTLDDATRKLMREGGIAVKDAGYYFRLPLLMGEHARIPGTAGLDRLMSSTTGRLLPAASNTVIGGVLNHWSSDAALQEAAHRMVTGKGPMSFQTAAATYLYQQEHKLTLRMSEKVGASDIHSLLQQHGEEAMNAAVRESETTGTGPVAEFFQRARVRNDQGGVRHGIITTKAEDGSKIVTFAPHYQTPEFRQLLTGTDPTAVGLRDLLNKQGWSAATLDDVSQSAQRRMLKPSETPYEILPGKHLKITDGTIDEFNEAISKLFPDFKGKALHDDFQTLATLYNKGMSRDIAKMAGVRKLYNTGQLRHGLDADALVTKGIDEAIATKANKAEIKRLRSLERTSAQTVGNIRKNLTQQYDKITGQLGRDLHQVVDEMQTLPPQLQSKIKAHLTEKQAVAEAESATSGGAATAVEAAVADPHEQLMSTIDQAQVHVGKQIDERTKKLDSLAPKAAAEMDAMDAVMASGDPDAIALAMTKGTPIKTLWDDTVKEQTAARLDQAALTEIEHRLAIHRAEEIRLKGVRDDASMLDLVESHLAADALVTRVGSQQVPAMKLVPPEPGEYRWHIPAYRDSSGTYHKAVTLRARAGSPSKVGEPSWVVRRRNLQVDLANFAATLPDSSDVKKWANIVAADAERLSIAEEELFNVAAQHRPAIDRAQAEVVRLRRSERDQETYIKQLEGEASKLVSRRDREADLEAFRQGSLAEGLKNYENAQSPVSEAMASHKAAQARYNQNRKALVDAASSEDRLTARNQYLDRHFGANADEAEMAALSNDYKAAEVVSRTEAKLAGPMTEARAQHAALTTQVEAAEEATTAARQAVADAEEAAGGTRAARRRRLAPADAETQTKIRQAQQDVRRANRALDNAGREEFPSELKIAQAEAKLDEATKRLDALQRGGRSEADDVVDEARAKLIQAGNEEQRLKGLLGRVSDDISAMREELIRARQQADQIVNPLASRDYKLQQAIDDTQALRRELEGRHPDRNAQRFQLINASQRGLAARDQAAEITRVFGEIEDSPRTWAARREASRQRRALEAQAAEHEATAAALHEQLGPAAELEARIEQSEARINRISGGGVVGRKSTIGPEGSFQPNIPGQQPVPGGLLEQLTDGVLRKEDTLQRVALSPKEVKTVWEPVPQMPMRSGLPLPGPDRTAKTVADVLLQGGDLAADPLRALRVDDIPSELQRTALTATPFGSGGDQSLPARAKAATEVANTILTDHSSRLLQPGPGGMAAVSANYMAEYTAMHGRLKQALDYYAVSASVPNMRRLEQVTADMTRANAYTMVYVNALAEGVEPSPEVAALILGEVMEREWSSRTQRRKDILEDLSPAGHAKRVERTTVAAEKARATMQQTLAERDQMLQWRTTGDYRFDENEMTRLQKKLSRNSQTVAKYYDRNGKLKLPVRDKTSDVGVLDYLTQMVQTHLDLINKHESEITLARSSTAANTAKERAIHLEASLDHSYGHIANQVHDNADLLEAIQVAESSGLTTVQIPPMRVRETHELSLAEAEQLLRNGDLSPDLRRKIIKQYDAARAKLAAQTKAEKISLNDTAKREFREAQAAAMLNAAEESGDVQYANRLRREAEMAQDEAAGIEELSQAQRVAANTREVRVYKMTPEGGKGELTKTLGAAEARAAYERVNPAEQVTIKYDIWQPGVEITELPLADAQEMYERNQRYLEKYATEMEPSQLEYEVLTGAADHQLDYIRGILHDNRILADAEMLQANADMIIADARAAGRELTETETDQVAMWEARAAVRRNSPEGLPFETRREMLQRTSAIKQAKKKAETDYHLYDEQARLAGSAINAEVQKILGKQGDLTDKDLEYLASVLPPEQSRAQDALRMSIEAIRKQRTIEGEGRFLKGQKYTGDLLTDDEIDDFRLHFANFYGQEKGDAFVRSIMEDIDAESSLIPQTVTEEGDEFGDVGITAARGRLRDTAVARARMERETAKDDMNKTLQAAGLKTHGLKTAGYYRDPREAIRRQLEARGVTTTRLASEQVAELDARITTIELIMRTLGRPVPNATASTDYIDIVARAQLNEVRARANIGGAAVGEGNTVGDMLANVRRQLADRPGKDVQATSTQFRSELRTQIAAARAAGDTERATTLAKVLNELDRKVRIFDRNPPPEEFIPPAIDPPSIEELDAPDIAALQADFEAAAQRRIEADNELATATGERDTAAQQPPVPENPEQVLQQQMATLDARIAAMEQYHATQEVLPVHTISPSEDELANLKMQRLLMEEKLNGKLTPDQQAQFDQLMNEGAGGTLQGGRTRQRATAAQQREIDKINSIIPDGGRHLDEDLPPASGAPADMDDRVTQLTQQAEVAAKGEAQAKSRLDAANAKVSGASNPSMIDNEAAAASAEGQPAPMVDEASPAVPAPSPDASVSGPRQITDPDLAAVQHEYEIAQSEYQNVVSRYGSYEAADEPGRIEIGRAAERVRKLDQMRQGMRRDAEEAIMSGDTAVKYQLDQAARRAQQEAIAAGNVTSDPEYILMRGTPSVKVMDDHAAKWKGKGSTVGGLEAEGRMRAIGGRGVHGKLTPSRPTYYDAARSRLDNLIDAESAAIRELEDQRDALAVIRQTTGDTPEVMARDAELVAERDALLEQAGRNTPETDAALTRKVAEEHAYTQQLDDIEAVPLVHARRGVADVAAPGGPQRLTDDLVRMMDDARRAVANEFQLEGGQVQRQISIEELNALAPPAVPPAAVEPPAGNPVAPRGPLDYTDEERAAAAAANAPTGPAQTAPPVFTEAAAAPPAGPPPAGGAPPPATPPAAGGAPTPPRKGPSKKAAATLPARPGAKGSASEWQAVLNDLNDINEARRILGVNDADVNKTAALLVAAAQSTKELAAEQITYDLAHKRLADFRKGSEKIGNTLKDVVADGWRELSWTTLPKGERHVIAEELGKSLDNFHKAISLPETWNLLDHYTRFFKTYATGRPGFHVRNTMSSMFMNLVAGVRLHAMWDAAPLWRQFEKDPHAFLSGLNPDSLEYQAFSAVFGSGAAGQFEDVGRRYGETIPGKAWKHVIDNKYTRWNQRMGARVEGTIRLGMALDSVRRGSNVREAMNRISKYHFDYTEMSAIDKQMRRLIPFWTFLSRNLPLQIEQMWARPRVYLQYRSLVRNFGEVPDPLTPQYWLDAGGFTMDEQAATDTQGSPSSWLAQLDLPFQTALEPVNAALEGNMGKAILSDINPGILAPMEAFGFNRKLFTGAPLEEGSYHAPNPAQMSYMWLFKLLGATKENALGETVIDDRYAHVARATNPILDLAERITDTTGTRAGRQDETLMRFLGLPVRELTPEVRQSTSTTAYYDRRDEADQRRRVAAAGTRD